MNCVISKLGNTISVMFFHKWMVVYIFSVASQASVDIRKSGWLDRLVEYHKQNFIKDLQKIPTVQIKATVEAAPPGYVDSKDWDYDSVLRLLTLIRQSEGMGHVRKVIRRALMPTRRMSIRESLKLFPSMKKYVPNDIYYDVEESAEYYIDATIKTPIHGNSTHDDCIIIVSNPVEARLPSAMISVNLLKEILEKRAQAARYMPKTRMTFTWKARNKTSSTTAASAVTTESSDGGKADAGNATGLPNTTA